MILPFYRQQIIQQPLGLFLDGQDVGTDFLKRAERLRLVKVPRKADFVSNLGGVLLDPCVRRVGQYLTADEGFYATVFQQWHLLGVPKVGVGLVFDNRGFAIYRRFKKAPQWVGYGFARLVHLGDDGRCGLDSPTHSFENLLEVGSGEFDVCLLERRIDAIAEDVMILDRKSTRLNSS